MVGGVQRRGADVAADDQGERFMDPDHSLVGASDRQVRAGADDGSGGQAADRQYHASGLRAVVRCLSIRSVRIIIVRGEHLRCVLGSNLALLRDAEI